MPEPTDPPEYESARCGVVYADPVSCRLQQGHPGDHLFNWPNDSPDAYSWRGSTHPPLSEDTRPRGDT